MTPRFKIDLPFASYSGDYWTEFIRTANRMRVESIAYLHCHITLTEMDLYPDLQQILEQMKLDALSQFDSRILNANPTILADQDWHDDWLRERWRETEALLDRFVEDHYFPMLRTWPLETSSKGIPDVQFSALIDLADGCRRRTYVMRESGRFELTVERLPTLTLDTAVVFELWKNGSKVGVVRDLLELAERQSASLRVTGRVFEDVPRPPLADEIANLPTLGIRTMSSVIRPHHWRVGIDTAGSKEFADACYALTSKEDRESDRDWKDWDHLHAHFLSKRDVFLTWDRKLRRYGDGLKELLGIVVLEPEEYLHQADRGVAAPVP